TCHPLRSLLLNRGIGLPHCGSMARFNAGAFTPVHVHSSPLGPVVVPERVVPTSFPTNTISSRPPSSPSGDTNLSWPLTISALGSGRAFPQRLTNSAFSCPSSCFSSSQEGYSRSGAFRVRSQRPKNGSTDSGGVAPTFLLDSLYPAHLP